MSYRQIKIISNLLYVRWKGTCSLAGRALLSSGEKLNNNLNVSYLKILKNIAGRVFKIHRLKKRKADCRDLQKTIAGVKQKQQAGMSRTTVDHARRPVQAGRWQYSECVGCCDCWATEGRFEWCEDHKVSTYYDGRDNIQNATNHYHGVENVPGIGAVMLCERHSRIYYHPNSKERSFTRE